MIELWMIILTIIGIFSYFAISKILKNLDDLMNRVFDSSNLLRGIEHRIIHLEEVFEEIFKYITKKEQNND